METPSVYISTGYKQVLHTLWEEHFMDDIFIRNLPADKDKAIKKAKEYAKKEGYIFKGIQRSPTNAKAQHHDFYNIQFKHKRKYNEKGSKDIYYGIATPEFWDAWKEDKEKVKAEGFSVSKTVDKYLSRKWNKPVEVWYVFFKPEVKE